jgi:hypothetical protein
MRHPAIECTYSMPYLSVPHIESYTTPYITSYALLNCTECARTKRAQRAPHNVRPGFACPWRLVLSQMALSHNYVGVVGGALASWGHTVQLTRSA